jgi:hypothetical protein
MANAVVINLDDVLVTIEKRGRGRPRESKINPRSLLPLYHQQLQQSAAVVIL